MSSNSIVTAKQIAEMILALPKEQQEVPLTFEYYEDSESSIPTTAVFEGVDYYSYISPHLCLHR